ncbi:unnamed protein product [Strongylus vulgaris]|uniref:Uncharacterized protein n=1 Tax=Strongylus vulgaris TaxID=40348 RepID=A0A3P7L609_STRVU|nr:unnamed protein product [Strongylus vulgaris]
MCLCARTGAVANVVPFECGNKTNPSSRQVSVVKFYTQKEADECKNEDTLASSTFPQTFGPAGPKLKPNGPDADCEANPADVGLQCAGPRYAVDERIRRDSVALKIVFHV